MAPVLISLGYMCTQRKEGTTGEVRLKDALFLLWRQETVSLYSDDLLSANNASGPEGAQGGQEGQGSQAALIGSAISKHLSTGPPMGWHSQMNPHQRRFNWVRVNGFRTSGAEMEQWSLLPREMAVLNTLGAEGHPVRKSPIHRLPHQPWFHCHSWIKHNGVRGAEHVHSKGRAHEHDRIGHFPEVRLWLPRHRACTGPTGRLQPARLAVIQWVNWTAICAQTPPENETAQGSDQRRLQEGTPSVSEPDCGEVDTRGPPHSACMAFESENRSAIPNGAEAGGGV